MAGVPLRAVAVLVIAEPHHHAGMDGVVAQLVPTAGPRQLRAVDLRGVVFDRLAQRARPRLRVGHALADAAAAKAGAQMSDAGRLDGGDVVGVTGAAKLTRAAVGIENQCADDAGQWTHQVLVGAHRLRRRRGPMAAVGVERDRAPPQSHRRRTRYRSRTAYAARRMADQTVRARRPVAQVQRADGSGQIGRGAGKHFRHLRRHHVAGGLCRAGRHAERYRRAARGIVVGGQPVGGAQVAHAAAQAPQTAGRAAGEQRSHPHLRSGRPGQQPPPPARPRRVVERRQCVGQVVVGKHDVQNAPGSGRCRTVRRIVRDGRAAVLGDDAERTQRRAEPLDEAP